MSFLRSQSFRVAALLALVLALAAALAAAGDRAAGDRAKVEAKLARQYDPIKKARLEVQLAKISFQEARKLYLEGDSESGLEKLKEMLSWSEKAHDRLFKTGRNPRKKPAGFKDAEITLRKLERRLAHFRLAVPLQDREEIQKITARLTKLREDLLLAIMRGKEKKK